MKMYLKRRTVDGDDKSREFLIQASGGYAVFIILCVCVAVATTINWLIKLI